MTSISDKVAHVKAATQTRSHGCHWPGCHSQVPPAMWGCRPHWYALPQAIRNRIWAAYRAGQENDMRPSRRYVEAAMEAQKWIRENTPK
jgi:hypothetical protein